MIERTDGTNLTTARAPLDLPYEYLSHIAVGWDDTACRERKCCASTTITKIHIVAQHPHCSSFNCLRYAQVEGSPGSQKSQKHAGISTLSTLEERTRL